jgi:hypothetical protein
MVEGPHTTFPSAVTSVLWQNRYGGGKKRAERRDGGLLDVIPDFCGYLNFR